MSDTNWRWNGVGGNAPWHRLSGGKCLFSLIHLTLRALLFELVQNSCFAGQNKENIGNILPFYPRLARISERLPIIFNGTSCPSENRWDFWVLFFGSRGGVLPKKVSRRWAPRDLNGDFIHSILLYRRYEVMRWIITAIWVMRLKCEVLKSKLSRKFAGSLWKHVWLL